jgi:hypothetical protein
VEGVDLNSGEKTIRCGGGLLPGDLLFVRAPSLTTVVDRGQTIEVGLQSVPPDLWYRRTRPGK